MKMTSSQLRSLIKQEVKRTLTEAPSRAPASRHRDVDAEGLWAVFEYFNANDERCRGFVTASNEDEAKEFAEQILGVSFHVGGGQSTAARVKRIDPGEANRLRKSTALKLQSLEAELQKLKLATDSMSPSFWQHSGNGDD